MKLDIVDLGNGITKLVLAGRMDIEGASSVDMQFSVIAGSRKKVAVDLTNVTFMASIGLRTIMLSVKAITSKGGKMVLVNPQPNVEKVLETTGVNTVIPVVKDMPAAIAALGA